MEEKTKNLWRWADMEPMTRSVVAVFAWRIGNVDRGDISGDGFVAAMTEAFKDVTAKDLVEGSKRLGPRMVQEALIGKLDASDDKPVERMVRELGQFAGGTPPEIELSLKARDQLAGSDCYAAMPTLRKLSQLAVGHQLPV